MRMKRRETPVTERERLTKKAPLAVALHKKECHTWVSKNRGIKLIERKRIYKLAKVSGMLGESITQLADRIGVPRRILGMWMLKDPKIHKNMQKGMDVMYVDIRRAAIKRACGYTEKRTSVATKRDVSGKLVEQVVTKQNVHVPGDPSMQKYLLEHSGDKRFAKNENTEAHIILEIDSEDNKL